MESQLDHHVALALLELQVELGAVEAIGDAPVNRFELPDRQSKPAPAVKPSAGDKPVEPSDAPEIDPVAIARSMTDRAGTLPELREAIEAFPHLELRKGAKNLVFADGRPDARVMIIGEAPGREEDSQGKPFVGAAGQLLDRMFAAIGLKRDAEEAGNALYIVNVLPYRPPQNRDPQPDEISMMLPFLERHVALAEPEVLILMGNSACQAVLNQKGITRLRGAWAEALGRPCLPMFHPAALLRDPSKKRQSWQDLLTLQSKLRETDVAH